MAKKRVEIYEFAPGVAGTTTITIGGYITLDQLLIITNVTDNVMLYNFADATFAGTSCTFARTNGPASSQLSQALANSDGITTITLQYNTSAMSSTDDILIYIEEENRDGMTVRPYAFGTDAIERIRVSNPTSLIDADFEYGLQPTKWAGFGTVKGYPSGYDNPAVDLTVSSITTDYTTSSSTNSLITVTFTSVHDLDRGDVINMSGLNSGIAGFSRADGTFIIDEVPSTTTLKYYARGTVGTSNGQSLETPESIARKGALYANAELPATTISSNGQDPSEITIGFNDPHGLVPGTPIHVILGDSGTNSSLATGPFVITNTPSLTQFKFTARGGGAITGMGIGVGKVYAISNAAILHRASDGGVLLSTKTPTYAASVVRQTKRYFRYQSGKGYLWSSGTLFAPNYDVQAVSAAGTTVGSLITIKTDDIDHGLQAGATVDINGVMTSGYNDTYVVDSIVDDFTFKVAAKSALGDTNAVLEEDCKLFVTSWTGAAVRAGMFDDANGVFFEYDGATLYAVKRSATDSITGTMAVQSSSSTVTGTNTRFTEQIRAGDRIVIKGMVHFVSSVESNTELHVTPDYRGIDASGVRGQKVMDKKIPAEHFNLDKVDGNGPSGYKFSPNHMQMLGLEFSWYGAGFINWMVRGPNGDWMYIHREKNNNVNEEAYMRTANLPVRYSIDNDSPITYLTTAADSDDTTLTVKNVGEFQPTGTLLIDNEIITYTGLDSDNNLFTNCTREATYSQYLQGNTTTLSAGPKTTHSTNTGLIEISNTCSPTLTHWGSALIMDGGFDFDRGYVFNYANSHNSSGDKIETTPLTSFLLRLAPSVSNASVGRLGAKELLNRSQLLVRQCAIALSRGSSSSGEVVVQGILNPKNFEDATWSSLNSSVNGGQPSFAQVANTDAIVWKAGTSNYAEPGETVFAFVANASRQDAVVTDLDLSDLKEMSGSPLGGDFMFPDGSDILAINAFVLSGDVKGTIQVRWQETQA